MKTSDLLRGAAVALMLGGGTLVLAQTDTLPDRGPIPFELYDTNGDKVISQDEFYDVRAQRMQKRAEDGYPMKGAANAPDFSEFDSNGDGVLTPEELSAGQQAQMSKKRGGGGMGQGPNNK